jgi:Right handed beta helix region
VPEKIHKLNLKEDLLSQRALGLKIRLNRVLPAVLALALLLSFGFATPAYGASLTGGNHSPIAITSNADFTNVGSSKGCACVVSGSGTASDPFVIGPWNIKATSAVGVAISGVTDYFTLYHITISGNNLYDGIDVSNVNAIGAGGASLDSIVAVNIDGAANGIFLNDVSGVMVNGNSVNNNFLWGVDVSNSRNVTVTFMTVAHNGLNNTDTHFGNPGQTPVWLEQANSFFGGVLFWNTKYSVLSVSELSEDGYTGFMLIQSSYNVVTDVHARYPDYFGGILQDSSNNLLSKISMQTADFSGLLVRGGGFNTIMNSVFSANGPIGNEKNPGIVPYFISGLYLGWGTHDNTITGNSANNGNTGPSLVVDDGAVPNPLTAPIQNNPVQPFNDAFGNDPGTVPLGSGFDGGMSTAAGLGNTICGNSFMSWYPGTIDPNAAC